MITKEMIQRGIASGTIKLIDSPDDGEPACQIGLYWFWYGGSEAAGKSSEEYVAATGMDDVVSEILDAVQMLGETEKAYYEAFLKEADQTAKKSFIVDIVETYTRSVIIMAETRRQAEDMAEKLCDSGEIDMERNCYAGREVNAHRINESHMKDYEVFWEAPDGN